MPPARTTSLAIASLVLMVILGGIYTYARVPLGFQIGESLGLDRNPCDKIGHFFRGSCPHARGVRL
jgi:putative membrane protein